MNSISDEQLFTSVQKGNKESMELIVHRYYANIFKYINYRVRDYYVAQDLCQECFTKVYSRRMTYSNEYPLKAWIYKIAYNITIDYFRSKTYKEMVHVAVIDNNVPDKGNIIEHKLFNNNIDDLTQGLSISQKDILNLRFKENLPIKEIALIMNINENTIKSRLYSALRAIKKRFPKCGGDRIEKVQRI